MYILGGEDNMSVWTVILIIAVIAAIILGVLYFVGRKMQAKQEDQRAQFEQSVKTLDMGALSASLLQAITKNEAPDAWRNVIGKLIHAIAGPRYSSYIERNQTINSKIALINLLLKEHPDTITQALLDQQKIRFKPTLNSTNDQICLKIDEVVQIKLCTAVRPYQ